jgi:hypothetical protein
MSESRSRTLPGPKPIDAAELVERLRQRAAPSAPMPAAPVVAHAGTVMTGRLVRHGPANYEFRAQASPSYFVELLTSAGPKRLWGVDLKRALAESKSHPQIGELIGVQRVGYQLVTAPRAEAGDDSGVAKLRRTRWRIDQVERFAASQREARREREVVLEEHQQLRQRPELRAAYVSLALARDYAERHIRDPADRERFLARLQEVMAASMVARSGRGTAARQGGPKAVRPPERQPDPLTR